MIAQGMSNFAMGTILGKDFAQAQVHTNHSTNAKGTSTVIINNNKSLYFA